MNQRLAHAVEEQDRLRADLVETRGELAAVRAVHAECRGAYEAQADILDRFSQLISEATDILEKAGSPTRDLKKAAAWVIASRDHYAKLVDDAGLAIQAAGLTVNGYLPGRVQWLIDQRAGLMEELRAYRDGGITMTVTEPPGMLATALRWVGLA